MNKLRLVVGFRSYTLPDPLTWLALFSWKRHGKGRERVRRDGNGRAEEMEDGRRDGKER